MVKDMRKTVDKVLFCLENNIGGFVSGTYIANNIGVSRNAIWKAVNDTGIESNIAKITEKDGFSAKIKALGDGDFRLRCMCRCGCENARVISELEFKADGLGAATFDPYNFVA